MNRIAKIAERIVLSYLEKMPDSMYTSIGNRKKWTAFVYDKENDRLYSGQGTMHKDLMFESGIYKEGEETYEEAENRTIRGLWNESEKVLLVYFLMINNEIENPKDRDIERVISLMKIEPRKIYLFVG